ncbi:DNA-directed RNA polymerase subunit delta [Virgibacillus kimchii]
MSLKKYSHEELERMSKIELANALLMDEKKTMDFQDIYAKVAEIKNLSEEDQQAGIAQFYTDLNVDGRFLTVGSNKWGLKRWYPVDKIDEDVAAAPKKKKKKKKKAAEEDVVELEGEELDIPDEDMDEIIESFDEEEVVDELDVEFEEEAEEEEDKI